MDAQSTIETLLASDIPSIRYKVRVNVLGEDPDSQAVRRVRDEVRESALVRALLARVDGDGRLEHPHGVYGKWQGAHWVMAALADIGYPPGDPGLRPMRDQLQAFWLSPGFYTEFEAASKAKAYSREGVPVMQGRHRRCASQQSNALWSIMKLGIEDNVTHRFVERLLHWQWPDGGWNCDKNPSAHHSSFMESILPLRALALYATRFDDEQAKGAAARASDIFLKRELFRRQSDGGVIRDVMVKLHYPLYWHYDILHALKVLAESGYIGDGRCGPALDLLESKRLADGGWPAEAKYYKASTEISHGNDFVDWGGTSRRKMNPWVTADALYVLRAAGRLEQ